MAGLWAYRDANREVMTRFGAKFLVMHGQQDVLEGTSRSKQTLVEFPSYQAAVDCYNHPDYQKAAELRHAVAIGSQVIVKGYDGPQDFYVASELNAPHLEGNKKWRYPRDPTTRHASWLKT